MELNPLDNLYNKASQYNKRDNTKMVEMDMNQFNRNYFKNSIPLFNQMSIHEISIIIKNNIDTISSDILKDDMDYAPLLRDQKFIDAFIRAISSIPIDYVTKLACNKITYDYFTSDNPEQGIKQLYLNMSKTVNSETIGKLMSIGLDELIASNLALCRYSSANENTNVKRLNFAIYHRSPTIMTEQMVVWIYEKLFNRISDLFQATMFEVYTQQQQQDFGENFMEVYGTVGLAVLTILNNMTSENIRKVLIGYNGEWMYKNKPPVRFSLHTLSGDFSRINRVVDYVTSMGTIIP